MVIIFIIMIMAGFIQGLFGKTTPVLQDKDNWYL